jgi:hypothetical protein
MRCETVIELLDGTRSATATEKQDALEHLAGCVDCNSIWTAVEALRADRDALIPAPLEGSLQRAVHRAVLHAEPVTQHAARRFFWRGVGVGVGGALAAGLLVAALTLRPALDAPRGVVAPQVTLALNEPRKINVALDSADDLQDAEIHVLLSGAIGLEGFDARRELRWRTNLDRGVNQLTLPLVAFGPGGGQVVVEVTQGERRRSFVIDVRTNADSASVG